MKFYRVYIEGADKGSRSLENRLAAEFGSGWRTLFAFKGHKWVKVFDWTSLRVARVRRDVWDAMDAELITKEHGYRMAKVKGCIWGRLSLVDREPTRFESQALAFNW